MKLPAHLQRYASFLLVFLLFLFTVITLSREHERGDPNILVPAFLATATGVFMAFLFLKEWSVPLGLSAGLVLRLSTLGTPPELSNDYHRFLWDAELQLSGEYRVFEKTPTEIMSDNGTFAHQHHELFAKMNSPDYHSVYPPFNQLFFRLAAGAPDPMLFFQLLMLAGDLVVFLLLLQWLKKLNLHPGYALIYFLHPMTVLEHGANFHFEGIMWAFLLGAFWMMEKQKWNSAGILLGLAFGIKMIPILLLPLLPAWIGWKRSIHVGIISGLLFCGSFCFMMEASDLPNFLSSVQLYFNAFEFNASLYYLFNGIATRIAGFNTIDYVVPFLQLLVLGTVFYLAFRKKNISTTTFILHVALLFLVYYLCASTVHPWYLMSVFIPSLMLGLRFGAVGLTLSMLSYFCYYFWGMGTLLTLLLCVEYFLLALLLWQERQAIRAYW